MKTVLNLILGTLLLTTHAWAQNEAAVKGYVIGPKQTDTYFVFEAEVTGDNCNYFGIDVDLQLVSSNKPAGKRTYKVEISTSSTVMACDNMYAVPLTVSSEVHKVPAGDQVKFIVPSWVTVRLAKK